MDRHDLFNTAMALANLSEDTDSNDWEVRNQILYTKNNPVLWHLICLIAATLTTNLVVTIWLFLEHINGWRRQAGKWDIAYAMEMMAHVRMKIELLEKEHPQFNRLLTLWYHHAGWIYASAGDFKKAAECHLKAWKLATETGDQPGKVLARYSYHHMCLNAKIVRNENLADAYRDFEAAMAGVHRQFGQKTFEDIRWRANACYHEIFYGWLVEKKAPSPEALNFLKNLPENLKPAFCLDLIWAIEAVKEYPVKAVVLAYDVYYTRETPRYSVNDRANALIVNYAALKASNACPDWLIPVLDEIQSQGHGGHLARAAIEHGLV